MENLLLIGKQLNCGKFAVPHWCPDWNVAAKLCILSFNKKFHSVFLHAFVEMILLVNEQNRLYDEEWQRERKQIFP